MRAWLRRLLYALRSLWERPDPMAALHSIEHEQAEAIRSAYGWAADDDLHALLRIRELAAGRDCPACQEVFRIADQRAGGEQ